MEHLDHLCRGWVGDIVHNSTNFVANADSFVNCSIVVATRLIENTVGQFFNKADICANATHDFIDSLQSVFITTVIATFDHIGVW